MPMNGFFAGGMAEGMMNAQKQGLEESRLSQDTALRSRGLDLQSRQVDISERAGKRAESQALIAQADKQIADTMGIVSETIKNGIAAGRDPAKIQEVVAPLVASAKSIAGKIGRNPASLDAMVQASLFQPTPAEAGAAAGTTKGSAAVAESRVKEKAGIDTALIDDPVKKVQAEGSLRDDYLKQAAPYITIRDAKNRIDQIEKTGAGDVALLFQYMKILDPGSTVREGEFATAANVAGVPGQIEALRKRVLGEGQLPEAARKQILSQANKLYQAAANQHDKLQNSFAGIAKRSGLSIDNVVVNLAPNGAIPPPPPGFVPH